MQEGQRIERIQELKYRLRTWDDTHAESVGRAVRQARAMMRERLVEFLGEEAGRFVETYRGGRRILTRVPDRADFKAHFKKAILALPDEPPAMEGEP